MAVESLEAPRRRDICPACRVTVIWGRIRDRTGRYKPISIEKCAAGAGDLAISLSLFDDGMGPIVELVANRTGYRSHRDHCPKAPPASHSAASFNRHVKAR